MYVFCGLRYSNSIYYYFPYCFTLDEINFVSNNHFLPFIDLVNNQTVIHKSNVTDVTLAFAQKKRNRQCKAITTLDSFQVKKWSNFVSCRCCTGHTAHTTYFIF